MSDLRYFDANVMAGRPRKRPGAPGWEPKPIGDLLDEFGIHEALVRHIESREAAPSWGNERVLEAVRGDDRLHPVWAALPHHTGEMPPPEALCRRMAEAGVRAVGLYPRTHAWSLEPWCAGPLLAAFERRRVPVLLDQDEASWSDIAAVLAAYPDLRLVLTDGAYRNARLLYPLLERFEHLHIEISGLQQHRGIDDLARRGWAGRVLFGSRMPLYTPGSALAAVAYADVSEAARALIAGGTLRRLIEEADL